MSAPILYADVPGFYAEVERALDPTLAGRPVLVGGDPRKRGLVQSATADARAAGVVADMPVVEALERCPRARALRTDMSRYRDMDKRLRAILVRCADRVEPAGLGAAYLGVPAETSFASDREPSLASLAATLRTTVARELHLPLRVGAGPVKFLARLAAEEAGPEGFLEVSPTRVAPFLEGLPVARLPGVGRKTEARLSELGVRCVGELIALGRASVERTLGNHGLAILAAAHGQGDDRIRAAPHPQSLSQEATLPEGVLDRAELGEQLHGLAERLERALALEGVTARRLALRVRFTDGEQTTRSVSLDRGLSGADRILELAAALLARTQAGLRPVRGLGLAASALARPRRDERQLGLFDGDR
jgi:nucleotidyltransferase/DNA polymerase involved in DNA repair